MKTTLTILTGILLLVPRPALGIHGCGSPGSNCGYADTLWTGYCDQGCGGSGCGLGGGCGCGGTYLAANSPSWWYGFGPCCGGGGCGGGCGRGFGFSGLGHTGFGRFGGGMSSCGCGGACGWSTPAISSCGGMGCGGYGLGGFSGGYGYATAYASSASGCCGEVANDCGCEVASDCGTPSVIGGFGRRHHGCGGGGGMGFSLGRHRSCGTGCGGCPTSGCGQSRRGLRHQLARLGRGGSAWASDCDCGVADGYYPMASYADGVSMNAGGCASDGVMSEEGPAPHPAEPQANGAPAEMPTPEVMEGTMDNSMNLDAPVYEGGTWGDSATDGGTPEATPTPAETDGALNPSNVDLYNPNDAEALPSDGGKDA